MKILDLLKSVDAFAQLSDDDLKQVATMVREMRVRIGAVMARQGEAGDALYMVSAGCLRATSLDATGSERELAEYTDGKWLGEMALLTGEPWGATVTAVADSTLLVLRKPDFDSFLGSNLPAMVQMMKLVAQRQAAARQRASTASAAQPAVTPPAEPPAAPVPTPDPADEPAEVSHPVEPVHSADEAAAEAPPSPSAEDPVVEPHAVVAPVAQVGLSRSAYPTHPPVQVATVPPPGVAWIPMPLGKLFTVFSPKGGAGKSMVATNLAVAMAKLYPGSVALLDLSLTFGHDMLLLNLVPRSCVAATTAEAFEKMDTEEELSYYLAVHPSSELRVMAGAVHPEEGELVSGDTARAAIDLLRRHFPYVVVDTGSNFTDPVLCALECADRVLLLCSPEMAVMRDARECQRILSEVIHLPRERVLYLLNSLFPFKTLSKKQFEEVLQQPIGAELPYGGDVPAKAA
ncbi:MAG TPA: cyclic nucleotide-binding domain-containing protein, partial [Chloroflexota bacterium]|nr:cyclic nucleotide-binding domain-containing protein [Chloroflexota bacterium]